MFRALFRFVGYGLLLLAFVALILDGVAILATGETRFMSAGRSWTDISPTTLNQVQFAIQEHLGLVWAWDTIGLWILLQPTFAVLGVLGLFFCLLGRRKKQKRTFAT
ncbi:MAG: hypothetical protein AAFW47_03305 [Pseudomonadota bacterium]